MKVLIIGSGGREHAICWALLRTSSERLQLFCAPGNAGIAQIAECVPINVDDGRGLASFAEAAKIDLTMIGPEAPLAAGLVNTFEDRGLRVVGPGSDAARLESSKAFAKDFMDRHSIPTARYGVATSFEAAERVLKSGEFGNESNAVVIKADGLAAGKGVFVAINREEAFGALNELKSGVVAAEAARRIVIEERLNGPEASVLLFSDGKDYRLMPAARDHKRIGENDTGPNTGGMGSITDVNILDGAMQDRIVRDIVEPTIKGCREEGFPFRGILFIGLMLTPDGPRVLEYNVRFGDPETQAILVRLQTDLAKIFAAISEQQLGQLNIQWSPDSSACVVLAARGYPAKVETGASIHGLERIEQHQSVHVFHAATSRAQGRWLTAGGRVLGVTATGENLDLALSRCYDAVREIRWDGMQYRGDIGRGTLVRNDGRG
ncbi:MAG: phosphoribosylamine--glycine ligase [Pyrinomonadaceae bacterium]